MKSSELEVGMEYAVSGWVTRAGSSLPHWGSVVRVRVLEIGVSYEVSGGFGYTPTTTKTRGVRIEVVKDERTHEHAQHSRAFPWDHFDIVKSASYFVCPWDEFVARRAALDAEKDAAAKAERKAERRAKKIAEDLSLLGIGGAEAASDGVALTLDAAEELISRIRHAEASAA